MIETTNFLQKIYLNRLNSPVWRVKPLEKELLTYIDGEYHPKSQAKVSVYDHGLLYGDGKPGPITRRLMQEFEKIVRDLKEGIPIYQ